MKKTKISIIGTVVLILCITIFVGCKQHGSRKGHAFALDYISETLDLTETQELHLANIKDEIEAKGTLLHKEKQSHEIFKEQLALDQMDEAVIKDLVDRRRAKVNQLIDIVVDRLIVFHKELTPDQKVKLIKKIEKFETWHNYGS